MGNYVFEIQKNPFAVAAWLKQGEDNRKFKMMTFTKMAILNKNLTKSSLTLQYILFLEQ